MNKYQLYTLGGALLTASSLSSHTASAVAVGSFPVGGGTFAPGALTIGNTQFSATTAATANSVQVGGLRNLGVSFTNNFVNNSPILTVRFDVTGAQFDATPTVSYLIRNTQAGSTNTNAFTVGAATLGLTLTDPTVTFLNTRVTLSNVQMASATGTYSGVASVTALRLGGVVLNGVTFASASGLATSSGSISLQTTVNVQGDTTDIIESQAATALITAAAPLTTSVATPTTAVVNASSTPDLYTNFSNFGGGSTMTLATVHITSTGALGTALATVLTTGSGSAIAGALSVTVQSTAISDTALVAGFGSTGGVRIERGTQDTTNTLTALLNNGAFTRGTFSSGTFTFTLSRANVTFTGTINVILTYTNGSAINAAAAGTVTASYITAATDSQAPSGGSGATATIQRGGLSAEANFASNGSSAFQSYIRVHNTGTAGGAVTLVLKRDADGTTIGTTTTANAAFTGLPTGGVVAAGGTIQIPVSQIETALGATPSGSYTVTVSGSFPGYIQHILFNGTTGAYVDLSSFRNGTAANDP